MIHNVSKGAISIINEVAYVNVKITKGELCKKLHLDGIDIVNFVKLTENRLLLQFTLRIKENSEVKFSTWVLVSDAFDPKLPPMESKNYPPFPVTYKGNKLFAKVIMLYRLDVYGGDCEHACRKQAINPEYCICEAEAVSEIMHKKLEEVDFYN